MKKVLSALFVFAVLCAVVAFYTLRDFKQNVTSVVIARISEKTGRTVTINDDVKIHFSLSPYVQIRGIKLSNPTWAEKPYIAQIDELKVQVGLFPLMQRKVVVKKAELTKVQIRLEINENGQKNWQFLEKDLAGSSKNSNTTGQKKPEKEIKYTAIENVSFKDIQFFFNDLKKGREFNTRIYELNLNRNKNGIEAAARLSNKKDADKITFKIESDANAQGKEKYKFLAKIDGAKVSGKAEGTMQNPFSDIRGQSAVTLRLAQIPNLNKILGYTLPTFENTSVSANVVFGTNEISIPNFEIIAGTDDTASVEINGEAMSLSPLSLTLHAKIDASNMGAVQGLPAWPKTQIETTVEYKQGLLSDSLKMKVGESDLSGTFSFRTGKDFLVRTNLRSNQLRLADILGKPYHSASVFSFRSAASAQNKKKERMFSSDFLPFDDLKTANIDIDVSVDRLIGANGADLGKTNLKATMHDGVFSMPVFNLANYALFKAQLDASKQPADINVGLKFNKMPLPVLFAQNNIKRGTVDGKIQLSGQGNSEAAIASSLNGNVFIDLRDVYAESFVMLSLPEILSFLMPFDINQPLSLSCAVINLPVKNGLISSQRHVGAESNIADLQVSGKVNLFDEAIELKVETSPHSEKVLQTVFNSANITGTLMNPVVNADKDKVFDRALMIGSAFLFGGKSAMQETMQQEKLKNVCATALAKEK
ncbi:MAG: AsmA family protein [Alphaproteobacteria bacterium]|nr:AsmA family protein [Alphaproteobacteria bacterium]